MPYKDEFVMAMITTFAGNIALRAGGLNPLIVAIVWGLVYWQATKWFPNAYGNPMVNFAYIFKEGINKPSMDAIKDWAKYMLAQFCGCLAAGFLTWALYGKTPYGQVTQMEGGDFLDTLHEILLVVFFGWIVCAFYFRNEGADRAWAAGWLYFVSVFYFGNDMKFNPARNMAGFLCTLILNNDFNKFSWIYIFLPFGASVFGALMEQLFKDLIWGECEEKAAGNEENPVPVEEEA